MSFFLSQLIIKIVSFICLSYWPANSDRFNICLSLRSAKKQNYIFFYLSLLFSGFCVHKWDHRKCYFITFYQA